MTSGSVRLIEGWDHQVKSDLYGEINSSPLGTVYMCQWTGSALIQITPCHVAFQHQAITWSNTDLWPIRTFGTNFNEIECPDDIVLKLIFYVNFTPCLLNKYIYYICVCVCAFSFIYRRWHCTGSWNPSFRIPMTYLACIIYSAVADNLATLTARAWTAMVLT